MRKPNPFPLHLARYYIHPVVTKVGGKQWAHICRGGKWECRTTVVNGSLMRCISCTTLTRDYLRSAEGVCGGL